jgi:hypothetical protein
MLGKYTRASAANARREANNSGCVIRG